MLDHYRRLLAYNRWANGKTLDSLGASNGEPPNKALRWMGHIIGSEYTWLARLRQAPPPFAIWPELDLASCAVQLAELSNDWRQVVAELSPEFLSDNVAYRNSKGEFWTSSVADILTHVTVHSGYHRGQIAAEIRQAGGTPAVTDFIRAAREGYIQ